MMTTTRRVWIQGVVGPKARFAPCPPSWLHIRAGRPAELSSGGLRFTLPDQDQADRGQRGAIARPLKLSDHEARLRPGDRPGALADPEQSNGEGKKSHRKKQFAHGHYPCPVIGRRSTKNDRVTRSFVHGKG